MIKLYISAGIFAAALGIMLLLLRPEWDRYSVIKGETTALNAVSSEFDTLGMQRDQLVEKINAISKDDMDRLLEAVPEGPKAAEFLLHINDLAMGHKLDFDSLTLSNKISTKSKTPTPAEAPALDALGQPIAVSDLKVEASIQGNYEDFKSFIADLENYIRITDATQIDLTPSSDKDKKDFFHYKLSIKTYYQ